MLLASVYNQQRSWWLLIKKSGSQSYFKCYILFNKKTTDLSSFKDVKMIPCLYYLPNNTKYPLLIKILLICNCLFCNIRNTRIFYLSTNQKVYKLHNINLIHDTNIVLQISLMISITYRD